MAAASPTTPEMERLRAEIEALRERMGDAARAVEERRRAALLAETPLADHDYRRTREGLRRIQTRLEHLESVLGALILELEHLPPSWAEAGVLGQDRGKPRDQGLS